MNNEIPSLPKLKLPFFIAVFVQFIAMGSTNPCLNGGSPIFVSIDNSEFRCVCKTGFEGPFCEYRDTTKLPLPKESEGRVLGFDGTFLNILLCIFFLLILPTLILYCIRTLYLFLKRCYYYQTPQRPLFPPNPSSGDGLPSTTEVVVQLPSNLCRPLHGTRSVPIHHTTSLTLNEFHEFLVSIQREQMMLREDGSQSELMARRPPPAPHHRSSGVVCPTLPRPHPPPGGRRCLLRGVAGERPPPYESVMRSSSTNSLC